MQGISKLCEDIDFLSHGRVYGKLKLEFPVFLRHAINEGRKLGDIREIADTGMSLIYLVALCKLVTSP